MYYHYSTEVTSPLSERNRQTVGKAWHQPTSENDFVTMQQKMLGLNTQQKNIMREYEDELDAMKAEIKKIRVDYDGLKQKNSRYRTQLKEKSEQLRRMAEAQARADRRHTAQPEETWNAEKTKLLARIKQLEIERKQAEERCKDLLAAKDENATLKREVESLKFRENIWKEEKEMAERKRRKMNEHKDWSSANTNKSTFTFDDAFEHMTRSDVPYKSLPAINILNYTESNDLQDIRKSLNEAREELFDEGLSHLILTFNQIEVHFISKMFTKYGAVTSKKVFVSVCSVSALGCLCACGNNKTVGPQMESKIASLESNCLTEVQNLVRNVDILKQELINSQRELQSLKEYSRHMEQKREEEKLQILNESRELKLDLSSLRTEIRDKSQGSDRTDQSRGPLTDTRERSSPLEKFESQYSPLVGFVGSRCDYLKMKLETLKKHLNNLDHQTQTVLTQSMGEAGDQSGSASSDTQSKHTAMQRQNSGGGSANKKRSNGTGNNSTNLRKRTKSKNNSDCNLLAAIQKQNMSADADDDSNDDDDIQKRNEDDDEDEIPVLTPRPHRNKYEKDMDTLIVENGENIERLRLPSLEEEDDEEEDEEEEDDRGCPSHRESVGGDNSDRDVFAETESSGASDHSREFGNGRHQFDMRLESPRRRRDRSLPRVEEEDESVINSFLSGEKRRATSLERQVDSRFEKLEQELENRRRKKGPMPAYHHLMPKSAH
ncbi:hypothetical protein EGW08_001122 [Elysia chlorotica]|uniref:Uncharacterized protein n=1 Tax=Elysia chlorotica TaxID=188477 RepID=A0A3S1AG64_ELYCH|nr:hypothetical protein EGW08_001122 [Elysia chlorotica]